MSVAVDIELDDRFEGTKAIAVLSSTVSNRRMDRYFFMGLLRLLRVHKTLARYTENHTCMEGERQVFVVGSPSTDDMLERRLF